jgi:hypothetical protein
MITSFVLSANVPAYEIISDNTEDVTDTEKNVESQTAPVQTPLFWSREHDIYFTLKSDEIRVAAYRALMRIITVLAFFGLYYILWSWYAMFTFTLAIFSCALSCLGLPFLGASCYAGILASLIHGIRIGNELVHVDVKWKA